MQMTKTEILLIRACKAKDSYKKVRQVYKRFYCNPTMENADSYITLILAEIIEKSDIGYPIVSLLTDLSPHQRYRFGLDEESDYLKATTKVLISKIRYTAVSLFNGFISPIRFNRVATD